MYASNRSSLVVSFMILVLCLAPLGTAAGQDSTLRSANGPTEEVSAKPSLELPVREIRSAVPNGKQEGRFGVITRRPADQVEDSKTPLAVRLLATRAPRLGEAINVTLEVHAYRPAHGTIAEIRLPAGARLLGGSTQARLDLATNQRARLTASISLNRSGEQTITGRALKTVSKDMVWGDSDSLYLTVGQRASSVGWKSAQRSGLTVGKVSDDRFNERLRAPAGLETAATGGDLDRSGVNTEFGPPEVYVPLRDAPAADASLSRPEASAVPRASISVNICWTTNGGRDGAGFKPLRLAYMQLWDADAGAHDLMAEGKTRSSTGCGFFFVGSNADADEGGLIDVYVRVWTYSAGRWRVTTNSDSIYSVTTSTVNNVAANVNFGTWFMGGTGGGNDAATLITDDLWRAYQFILEHGYLLGGIGAYPGEVWVRFQGDSTDGDNYSLIDGKVHLTGASGNGSRDTVVHEANHRYMHLMYGADWPPSDCPSPHFISGAGGMGCAWSEGYTYLVVAGADANPVYRWASGATLNLETPTCDSAGWDDGGTVEGRVGGVLIDLADPFTLSFATPTGFGNDAAACFGRDQVSGMFDAIWDLINDQNDDVFVAAGGNTDSFSNAWELRQYPRYEPSLVGNLNSINTFARD